MMHSINNRTILAWTKKETAGYVLFNLSNFSSKTISHPKIQELSSFILFECIAEYLSYKKFINKYCEVRSIKSVYEEVYKRLVLPFYIM